MRKRHSFSRDVLADPVYNSKVVTKLVNRIMLDGKRGKAQKIVYSAFDMIQEKQNQNPLDVFTKAMENSPQFYNKYYNHQNSSRKKTFHQTLEDHTLSLRKRKNNRQMQYEIPPELLNDVSYKINISEIEQKICKEELYLQYKNANNEKISLGFLFQMLLSKNDDLIKFSVGKIREFLINTNKKEFKEKNYAEE